MPYRSPFLLISFLLFISFPLHARIIEVPADSTTIQSGIHGAVDGDTVRVAPGTYPEHGIDFLGKAIVVTGSDPEDSAVVAATVVDAFALDRVFIFQSGEDSTSILAGLTITRGVPGMNESGGGVNCVNASPKIYRNIITENTADWQGGGIHCDNSSAVITGNIITDNRALYSSGGGIFLRDSNASIRDNVIDSNASEDLIQSGGGGIVCFSSDATIVGNRISNNRGRNVGGGIWCHLSDASILHNEITGNWTNDEGGGIAVTYASAPTIMYNTISENLASVRGGGIDCSTLTTSPIISSNIIADNWAINGGGMASTQSTPPLVTFNVFSGNTAGSNGGGIFTTYSLSPIVENCIVWDNFPQAITGNPDVTYSDVEGGWAGTGNIDANPLLITFRGYDYFLRRGSPCIDTGDPALEDGFDWPPIYNNGTRSDMGAYGGPDNQGWR